MYADDLILLDLTVSDQQKMINICKVELDWLDMKVNAKKSGCIRIGQRCDAVVSKIFIDGEPIAWVSELPYLGIVIKSAKTFKCCFHLKKLKFYRSINGILGKLGNSPPISVILSLVSINCNRILLHGLEALKFTKSDISSLSHPYDSVYMKIFQSFNRKTVMQCQFYCGELPLEYLIDKRTLNFYSNKCLLFITS